MLQNAYFLAKIGADTAENEQHFAEILPIGRRVGRRVARARPNSASFDSSISRFPTGAVLEVHLPRLSLRTPYSKTPEDKTSQGSFSAVYFSNS